MEKLWDSSFFIINSFNIVNLLPNLANHLVKCSVYRKNMVAYLYYSIPTILVQSSLVQCHFKE